MIHFQKYTDMHYSIYIQMTNLGWYINYSTFNTMFKTLSNFGTKPCEMHEEKTTWLISKRIYRYARPPRINHHFSPSTVNFSSKNNYRTNNKFCRYFLCSQQVIYAKFFSYHPTILAIDSQWLLIVSIRLFLDLWRAFRHFEIAHIIENHLLFLLYYSIWYFI